MSDALHALVMKVLGSRKSHHDDPQARGFVQNEIAHLFRWAGAALPKGSQPEGTSIIGTYIPEVTSDQSAKPPPSRQSRRRVSGDVDAIRPQRRRPG